ncbi:MAG: DNA glycosylase AlkZ-like family protein, partial [Capnocytophaga ochracea]
MKKINIPMIRLRAQQLINPDFTDVKDVVAWMGAIQAQQPRMAKLALGIRTRGATMQQTKQALDRGEILRTHVLRPTWHYVSPSDIRWMLKLSCNRLKSAYASLMKGHGLTITEQMYDT